MEHILNFIVGIPSAVLPLIVLLGLLIFVHELGHFLVARWCGVRVEVFSLGFGKKFFQYKRGDTTYCLSVFPLGGYVKMFGEQAGDNIPEDEREYSFTHKKVWQRVAIVLAGPVTNFLFAIFIFLLVVMGGEEAKPPIVGDVKANSAAYHAGFRSGDHIVSIGDVSVTTWDQVQERLNQLRGLEAEFKVQREGTNKEEKFPSEIKSIDNPNPLSLTKLVGDIDGLTIVSEAGRVSVQPKSFAETLGFQTGDRIDKVNDQHVSYYRELEPLFANGGTYKIEITRGEDPKKLEHLNIDFTAPEASNFAKLGFGPTHLFVAQVFDGTPASKAGLQAGDRFVSIDGKKMESWEQVLGTIKEGSDGKPLDLVMDRKGEEKNFQITPEMTSQMNAQGQEEKRFVIGVMPLVELATPESLTVRELSPIAALFKAVDKTWDVTVMTFLGFVRMFQGKISPKNIGGFISIGQVAHDSFQLGISHFLSMMAIISVNLFALNLLPVPLLDGGHLLFYLVEGAKGEPLSMRKMEIAQQVGMALLLSLMIYALFNDFSRLFQSM